MQVRPSSYWRNQLLPLRLEDGPIEQQLRKAFWTMVVGNLIAGVIGSIILAIFVSFGRGDLGFEIVATLFLFPCLLIWFSFFRLTRRVKLYLLESEQAFNNDAPQD